MLKLSSVFIFTFFILLFAIQAKIHEYTLLNISLPFNLTYSDIKPGVLVILDGVAKSNPNRFAIDFLRDFNGKIEVIFHLNPRFRQQSVVRNTKLNGRWGKEERERKMMPIKPNEQFQIAILVTSECYRVVINGKHFSDYKHRLPYSSINKVRLWGDIIASKLQIKHSPLFKNITNILPVLKPANYTTGNENIKPLFIEDHTIQLFDGLN